MRRFWLILGTVLTGVTLFLSTSVVWQLVADPHPPTEVTWRTIPFQGATLTVRAGRDDVHVHILAGRAGSIGIERELTWTGGKPDVSEQWSDGVLRLDGACKEDSSSYYERVCLIQYRLFVPPETDVEASASSMLSVGGMHGDVRLTSVWGDVSASDTTGDLLLRSDSGNIDGNALRADAVDAETGSGRVNLDFDIPPSDVRAVVRASGDVEVDLPNGVYDVTADAPNTRVKTRSDPTSARKVVATTPDGGVFICC